MISTTFKDRFEEFADTISYTDIYKYHHVRQLMSEQRWLNALSEIDKQVAEESKIKDAEIQGLRRGNARYSLELGFIDELIEDNCKGEIPAMMMEYDTNTSDKVGKLLQDRKELIDSLTIAKDLLSSLHGLLSEEDLSYEPIARIGVLLDKYSEEK